MATIRPVTGDEGWGVTYDAYEEISHNTDGTLKLIGSEGDGQTTPTTTGFQFFSINGVSTKVYTKYLTGTQVGNVKSVAHEIDDFDDIVSVAVILKVEDEIGTELYRLPATDLFIVSYDATNIIINAANPYDGTTDYRIKIEYTA